MKHRDTEARLPEHSSDPQPFDAVIVGAGFSGLYQLYRLRELGLRVRVVEAASGVGGTWHWNRYPGARCDVESMSYSYSFSPELDQQWRWTERYASQPEILAYLNHVADRFALREAITFDTRVVAAAYDEASRFWQISTDTGESLDARFLIFATGCLSTSKDPEIPGSENFLGQIYHTGRWPHEGVDFTGQRVGVVGTGSSGLQSIPKLAEQSAYLTVFQRTPTFALPALNRALSDEEVAARRARYPEWRQAQKVSRFGVPADTPTLATHEASAIDREATYQRQWNEGTLYHLLGAYTDVATDRSANETAAEFIRSRIRDTVHDADVAELLSPRSYPFGAKRPCLDTNYYATFNRPNVTLVSLASSPLVEITPAGLRTTAAEYELDVIVFATGFDAMTGTLNRIDIRGRKGASLRTKWADGPLTYLGLGVADYPNMFTITGPTSPSVLTNMAVSIEQHIDWITDCITYMRAHGWTEIDATASAERQWIDHVAEAGARTLYPQADSWYVGANVPGKPRVLMAYVGGVGKYRMKCDEVAENDYAGFAFA